MSATGDTDRVDMYEPPEFPWEYTQNGITLWLNSLRYPKRTMVELRRRNLYHTGWTWMLVHLFLGGAPLGMIFGIEQNIGVDGVVGVVDFSIIFMLVMLMSGILVLPSMFLWGLYGEFISRAAHLLGWPLSGGAVRMAMGWGSTPFLLLHLLLTGALLSSLMLSGTVVYAVAFVSGQLFFVSVALVSILSLYLVSQNIGGLAGQSGWRGLATILLGAMPLHLLAILTQNGS